MTCASIQRPSRRKSHHDEKFRASRQDLRLSGTVLDAAGSLVLTEEDEEEERGRRSRARAASASARTLGRRRVEIYRGDHGAVAVPSDHEIV